MAQATALRFPRTAGHGGRGRRVACIALACAVLLSACSAQFFYNRLDRLLHWYFSNQITLTDTQSQDLRQSLQAFLAWHRRSELPRYAALLEQVSRDAAQPLGRARIDALRLEVEQVWRGLVSRAAPDAARWLATLSDAQLDELFVNLAEDDGKLRKRFCETDPAKRLRTRERSLIDNIENWTGRLSAEQRELVKAAAADLRPTQCAWVANRAAFRDDFRALLERRAPTPEFGSALTRFLAEPEGRWPADYRADFTANRERLVSMLAELDATLTPRQRTRLTERFARFARDMRALADA